MTVSTLMVVGVVLALCAGYLAICCLADRHRRAFLMARRPMPEAEFINRLSRDQSPPIEVVERVRSEVAALLGIHPDRVYPEDRVGRDYLTPWRQLVIDETDEMIIRRLSRGVASPVARKWKSASSDITIADLVYDIASHQNLAGAKSPA